MSADPVKPILATKHYSALERRLYKIMLAIDECVKQQKNGIKDVVMAEYHSDEILENAMDFLANDGENEETKGEKNTDFNNLETNLKLQR
ncbi:unnamed protein product [Dracunculus medinensis]|uniref:Fam20C domain-containing protein n=1 Tax=Dracunculus medinensis TaxID=318479 RepID=A0A0N4URX4_DRAME|nr:unnamed protein product [Dracunculus medinensis]